MKTIILFIASLYLTPAFPAEVKTDCIAMSESREKVLKEKAVKVEIKAVGATIQ